jgi:L-aminopeptidase/D-esterase-like protein
MLSNHSLTAIDGLKVGHWQGDGTGCTVVLCPPDGCIASGSVRGGAPGTRETALLEPAKTIERVHAIVLTGGSAFGLVTAHGVMDYLLEQERGFLTPHGRVPIVPAAAIYDLSLANEKPTLAAGYEAAKTASSAPIANGRLGAGSGASCGKYVLGGTPAFGGLGSALVEVAGAKVAALAVCNPLGDIVDSDGSVVAGAKDANGNPITPPRYPHFAELAFGGNTTLVVVGTDAAINKRDAHMLADSAHSGIAHVTYPSHTPHDGDTCFVISTEHVTGVPLLALSVAVQEVVSEAIVKAARAANP